MLGARSTILQTVTPDSLRGRANAVNSMVVVGGPMLGDLRAGAKGGLVSPGFSLVGGGGLRGRAPLSPASSPL